MPDVEIKIELNSDLPTNSLKDNQSFIDKRASEII